MDTVFDGPTFYLKTSGHALVAPMVDAYTIVGGHFEFMFDEAQEVARLVYAFIAESQAEHCSRSMLADNLDRNLAPRMV